MAMPRITSRSYRQSKQRTNERKLKRNRDDQPTTESRSNKSTPRRATSGERARALSKAAGISVDSEAATGNAAFGAGTPKKETPKREEPKRKTVNDLSKMGETKVVAKRVPTPQEKSEALKANKAVATKVEREPKAPKMAMDTKKDTGPAPMMRREAATAKGMPAEGQPKSIAEARKAGKDTFIGNDGRKKAAVTKEELEASGYKSLREYLNAQKKSKPKAMKNGGKTSSYKKGGSVRGAGIAKKGFRPPKMVSMKGS